MFVVASNALSAAPASAATVSSTVAGYVPIQVLAQAQNYSFSGSRLSDSTPALIMYKANDAAGNEHIYGLDLRDTTIVPAGTQISSLSSAVNAPSTGLRPSQICDWGQGQGDLSMPTSLFLLIHIAGKAGCYTGFIYPDDAWYVVHYTDSAETAPVPVTVQSSNLTSLYTSSGALGGIVLINAASEDVYAGYTVDFYADDTFVNPVVLLTNLAASSVVYAPSVGQNGPYPNSVFIAAQSQFDLRVPPPEELYQITYQGQATLRYTANGALSTGVADATNFYFTDTEKLNPSSIDVTSQTVWQEPIAGAVPTMLLSSSANTSYNLLGSNGSVLVLDSSNSSNLSWLWGLPVGTLSNSVTLLGDGFKSTLAAFVASATPGNLATDLVFATLSNFDPDTGVALFSTQVLAPTGAVKQATMLNSAFVGPINPLGGDVFMVTGITDTGGYLGGGTLNNLNLASLSPTPFTTTGGQLFKVPGGSRLTLQPLSSTVGGGEASSGSDANTAPAIGLAYDSSSDVIYPVSVVNANVTLLWSGP